MLTGILLNLQIESYTNFSSYKLCLPIYLRLSLFFVFCFYSSKVFSFKFCPFLKFISKNNIILFCVFKLLFFSVYSKAVDFCYVIWQLANLLSLNTFKKWLRYTLLLLELVNAILIINILFLEIYKSNSRIALFSMIAASHVWLFKFKFI